MAAFASASPPRRFALAFALLPPGPPPPGMPSTAPHCDTPCLPQPVLAALPPIPRRGLPVAAAKRLHVCAALHPPP
eukprot:CAMPEP_0173452454 /NCGR_PEP_ID=MMETSP1357-20121228/48760_1 /TAXON_ID=77926 /ORGANISM="Hemiselmis rufescens, Strain PCC563" /LENGTH=75 /DNA_ID=CAMNT_0014419327 /DNA_START=44 /DNA_END=269 /DNA_ORIENTATION=+